MIRKIIPGVLILTGCMFLQTQVPDAIKWQKYELKFTSSVVYENPVQDVRNALLLEHFCCTQSRHHSQSPNLN
jgi:hypothetical protein